MSNAKERQCVQGVHHLIGSTLRDARRERTGRVVGIDQTREHPVVDIIWQGQGRAERIIVTCDQLRALVEACCQRGLRAANSVPVEAATATTTVITEQRQRA